MRFVRVAVVAAALAVAFALPSKSEAKTYLSFGYYGPGVSFYAGHYPYYYYPYRYRPYYYYGYRPRYYRYRYSYRRSYRYRRYARRYRGRCARWSRRCAANWGYGGNDYRGCMRYHGCR